MPKYESGAQKNIAHSFIRASLARKLESGEAESIEAESKSALDSSSAKARAVRGCSGKSIGICLLIWARDSRISSNFFVSSVLVLR